MDASVLLAGNPEDGLSLWFSWELTQEDLEWPRCDDQVMLMAYFPDEMFEYPAYYKVAGAKRKAGQDVLEIPVAMAGKSMEVYIAVIAEDRSDVSRTQYLGRIVAPDVT
ncbi:hypothetical protein FA047_07445 [Pedobacter frigoris]|uniref:Uncharacterized protein n=2 Tax=Pedobacter frigoris TaxID=2571272 RepID=A0A4U1CNR0_9SPHI|nr:hypothetical protein FA047_07445 [Pedobacter frigoris]